MVQGRGVHAEGEGSLRRYRARKKETGEESSCDRVQRLEHLMWFRLQSRDIGATFRRAKV